MVEKGGAGQRERGAEMQERCLVGTRFQHGKTKMLRRWVVVAQV